MSTTQTPSRFDTLPDEQTLAATVTALEEHGFSVEVVDDLEAARQAVLSRIPHGSSVMTNTSVTLQQTGIADAVNDGGPYDSARTKMAELDFATQLQEMKAIGGQPVHGDLVRSLFGEHLARRREQDLPVPRRVGTLGAVGALCALGMPGAQGSQGQCWLVHASHSRAGI